MSKRLWMQAGRACGAKPAIFGACVFLDTSQAIFQELSAAGPPPQAPQPLVETRIWTIPTYWHPLAGPDLGLIPCPLISGFPGSLYCWQLFILCSLSSTPDSCHVPSLRQMKVSLLLGLAIVMEGVPRAPRQTMAPLPGP